MFSPTFLLPRQRNYLDSKIISKELNFTFFKLKAEKTIETPPNQWKIVLRAMYHKGCTGINKQKPRSSENQAYINATLTKARLHQPIK